MHLIITLPTSTILLVLCTLSPARSSAWDHARSSNGSGVRGLLSKSELESSD